jgi:Ca2+-transporting ATPase
MVKVIREGNQIVVGTSDLVVGDVCRLEAGDLVPADGILIKSFGKQLSHVAYN